MADRKVRVRNSKNQQKSETALKKCGIAIWMQTLWTRKPASMIRSNCIANLALSENKCATMQQIVELMNWELQRNNSKGSTAIILPQWAMKRNSKMHSDFLVKWWVQKECKFLITNEAQNRRVSQWASEIMLQGKSQIWKAQIADAQTPELKSRSDAATKSRQQATNLDQSISEQIKCSRSDKMNQQNSQQLQISKKQTRSAISEEQMQLRSSKLQIRKLAD